MRRAVVPVDLVSEQKSILAILSYRQLIYLSVGGTIAYQIAQAPIFSYFPFTARVIVFAILIAPIALIVFWLGFLFRDKDDMYWDKYLLLRLRYLRKKGKMRYHHGDTPPSYRSRRDK